MRELTTHKYGLPRTPRGSLYYWLVALLIAALYAWLTFITPLLLDDWVYWGIWRDDAGNTDFSPGAFGRYIHFVRLFDNGRIPNITAPFEFLISPTKELFPFVTGVMLALTIVMVQRLATGNARTVWLAAAWAAAIIFLPFRDTLFANIYAYNYIWSGFLSLCFLWLLRRGERSGWTPALFIGCLVMAVVCGGWHESFAAATLCGLGLLAISRRFRFSARFYIIVALYLASAVAFLLSPGMLGRIHSTAEGGIYLAKRWYYVALLDAAAVLCYLFFRQGRAILREALKSDVALVCAGIIIAGYFIGAATSHTPRSIYWPALASIVLGLYLISRLHVKVAPALRRAFTGILVILCTLQTLIVIYWQARYTEDWENVMSRLDSSESGSVFYDSPNPREAPWYTLGIPIANSWRSPWHLYCLWTYYMTPVLGVAPTALENADLNRAIPLEGEGDKRLYGDYIIARAPEADPTPIPHRLPEFEELRVKLPSGQPLQKTRLVAMPFVTASGDTLVYYIEY